MASIADFKTYLAAARTAFAADDVAEALKQITLAETVLPELPSTSADGVSINYNQAVEAIKLLRRSINGSRAGGVHLQGIEFHG